MYVTITFLNSIWVQFVDRLQQKLDLVLIPIQLFRPCRIARRSNLVDNNLSMLSTTLPAQILCTVFSQNWINVTLSVFLFSPTSIL